MRPARKRGFPGLALALLFTAGGVLMIRDKQGGAGWFCALFFGLCSLVFALQLWPGASYLRISTEGFEMRVLLRRRPLVRWDRVSEFRVAALPGAGRMVVYSPDPPPQPGLAAVNRALVGETDALPDNFGRSPEQLAELLNEWRRNGAAR
ncbi:MAG TPA: hypothetical protein VL285_23125 [Bryobacteraceae bacterium]|nr:hypothetical protein [Bryobacteraceae bacterium]